MGPGGRAMVARVRVGLVAAVLVGLLFLTGAVVASQGVAQIDADTQTAQCTASPTEVTPGEVVTLDASESSGEFIEFDVDGDGEYERVDETDFVIEVTYDVSGTYTPQIRVGGDTATTAPCGEVTVAENEPPTADYTIDPRPATVGEPVTFDGSASSDPDGEVVEYRWDFDGDGTVDQVSEQPVVEYTFDQDGGYAPALTVVDDDEATDSRFGDLVVESDSEVVCLADPQTVEPGDTVTLDASDSDANFVEFDVDGDGVYDFTDETDFVIEVVYEEPETYNPIARANGNEDVTDPCGEVTVAENEPPTADYTIDPRPATVGEPVTFDGSASSDPDGEIVEYRWDFDGDGTVDQVSEQPVAEYTFDQDGGYAPNLTVVDDDGETDSRFGDLVVEIGSEVTCRAEPLRVAPGEPVTLDASGSTAEFVEFDVDGDGEYERGDETDFVVEVTYEEPGTYVPAARAGGDETAVSSCGDIVVEEPNEPPEASLSILPNPAQVGDSITFDASGSTDPDGQIVEYRWDFDGDGTVDDVTSGPTATTTRQQAITDTGSVTVVDDANATARASSEYVVEPVPEPSVTCVLETETVEPGGTVVIDASDAENAFALDVDIDGDGSYERQGSSEFVVEVTYEEPGTYEPVVRAVGELGEAVAECGQVVVEQPETPTQTPTPEPTETPDDDDEESFPLLPLGIGAGGLAGLGLLGYYLFGGGGGSGGGGSDPKPKRKPRPKSGSQSARYETGVFAVPPTSGAVPISLGFEPDVLTFTAANGARTDATVDRTAGWSKGVVVGTGDDRWTRSMTVGDDATAPDQATCAVSDDAALELVRHQDDDAPGRISLQVTETTTDGFTVDVSVPGDDPLASGIRVVFTAIRLDDETSVEPGEFQTPTEPGVQTVDLGQRPDHLSVLASSAVSDSDALWTTDRCVGLGLGYATRDGATNGGDTLTARSTTQVTGCTSTWPGVGHPDGALCSDSHALALLYQDGDDYASKTTALVAAMDETLRLRYDRVYNGPHKLGSTARHPVSYLAVQSETMCPAVGTFDLPAHGESAAVECGFQPALLELTIVPAQPDGNAALGTAARPFSWSQGTAIATGSHLRQYVIHHAVGTDPVPVGSGSGGGEPASDVDTGTVASDGGDSTRGVGEPRGEAVSRGVDTPTSVPDAVETPLDVEPLGLDEEPPARDPTAFEDGRIGLWLPTDDEGTVVGRDELRVTETTATGFRAAVRRVDTTERERTETRPTVVYRAWPMVEDARERTPAPDTGDDWWATDPPIDTGQTAGGRGTDADSQRATDPNDGRRETESTRENTDQRRT
jgi:PKD repeat protein